ESLYRKATGEGREAVTAAIFWLKTRAVSLGVEFSLNVGSENSMRGAWGRRPGARPGPPGFRSVAEHSVRHDSDGGGGGPAWRINDDPGSSPSGTLGDRDRTAHGP